MIDTQAKIRQAFYEALNGNLTYNAVAVPLFDEMADTTASVYVILSTQTTTDYPTLNGLNTNETILLDIVHKTGFSITKDAIDNVSTQVLSIIIPTAGQHGLPDVGIQFSNVRVESINTITFQIGLVRKLIRFSLKVNQ